MGKKSEIDLYKMSRKFVKETEISEAIVNNPGTYFFAAALNWSQI